jgi:hypothetical protein
MEGASLERAGEYHKAVGGTQELIYDEIMVGGPEKGRVDLKRKERL